MDCIDLKERYRKRYKVVSEDGNSRNTDPWLWQIPCRYGHIYPHGGDKLGAAVDGIRPSRMLARFSANVPSSMVWQSEHNGANIVFDVRDFNAVVEIMRPKRRRQLTPEQRARLASMGRRFEKKDAVHVG
jgi:hypothetical protein